MTTTPDPLEAALRALPLFTMIGCPEWCSWSVTQPEHEHLSDGRAEVVVTRPLEPSLEAILEVRHAAAPSTPNGV